MIHRRKETGDGLRETSRLEAFSDGVFAIAVTLLVLDLIEIVHTHSGEGLLKTCLNHGAAFLAFFIGFCTILVCWINHHHIFLYIHKTDNKLLWANGFVLLAVTFTPFPTAILAEYLKDEGNTAFAIYGFNYFIIAVSSYCITAHAYNKHLVHEDSRDFFYCVTLTYGYSIIYTLLAFVVCFISIPAATVLYIILFGVFAFPAGFAQRLLNVKKPKKNKLISRKN